ncbi:hypothetical protein HNO52_20395 [Billgrantia diversa]|uniref:hypothetical protein n=1 Tax=Halomonas sp. MCCC 1A13316 TaxID=2733487 RepID=UPI0018A4C1E9|nr:hypothetical protein [Halomonas sp. MCCC 1A13316]QOR40621.1 hypothetical protein HNO52_20395 [Halomonas sp. MCCC 1A13316]
MPTLNFQDLLTYYPFGLSIPEALDREQICEAIKDIAAFSTSTLPTLLYTGEYPRGDSNVRANSDIVTKRFTAIAEVLYRFAVLDHVKLPEKVGALEDDVLDFRVFVGLGAIATEYYGEASYQSLCHLLAAFLVRYKVERILSLDRAFGYEDAFLGGHDLSPAGLEDERFITVEEISIATGLKLETIKNAVSRGELPRDRQKRIAAWPAIAWMSRKDGFPWGVTCYFLDPHLPLNGQYADAWLNTTTDWERIYSEPQETVSTWRIPRSHRYVMVNSGGRRQCVLTLPFEPSNELMAVGLTNKTDRSKESTSHFHDRGFPGGRPAQLWQVTVPSLEALKGVIEILSRASLNPVTHTNNEKSYS